VQLRRLQRDADHLFPDALRSNRDYCLFKTFGNWSLRNVVRTPTPPCTQIFQSTERFKLFFNVMLTVLLSIILTISQHNAQTIL
jgi:hypothetical protein